MKILFLANHRFDRNPGQRYRFEQYFDFLESKGISCELSNIISKEDDQILYQPGNYVKKFKIALKGIGIRSKDLKNVRKGAYDLVVFYRESLLLGSTYFERAICKTSVPTLYDFDDAIWVKDVSEGNKKLAWLKNANKINTVLPHVQHVTAGNEYLANHAKKYNPNVTIIPSTVNTQKYRPLPRPNRPITIGWIGSKTTVKHFETLLPVLQKIKAKYSDRVAFKVIGDPNYQNEALQIKGEKWINAQEVEHFNALDIGVMPLPDDPWAKGKCGMKGLLYMSVGVPSLFSPVGMNTDIVQEGENGYLPATDQEWFEQLCALIEQPELRQKIGQAGRQTVEKRYSKQAYQETYLHLYLSLINQTSK